MTGTTVFEGCSCTFWICCCWLSVCSSTRVCLWFSGFVLVLSFSSLCPLYLCNAHDEGARELLLFLLWLSFFVSSSWFHEWSVICDSEFQSHSLKIHKLCQVSHEMFVFSIQTNCKWEYMRGSRKMHQGTGIWRGGRWSPGPNVQKTWKTIIFQGSSSGPTFFQWVSYFFQVCVWGVQMFFFLWKPRGWSWLSCEFPGGNSCLPPLDPQMECILSWTARL